MSEGGSEQATSSIAAATATGDAAATVPDDDHATKVQMTQVQMEEIEKEIRESQSLASDLLDISFLKQLYAKNEDGSNTFFLRGIDSLSKIYPKFRTVRGDGNCYYRSFLYQLSERLLQDKEEYQRILQYVKDSSKLVTSVGGYEEMTIEIFYDSLVEFLESLPTSTAEAMHTELTQENATSDYCTWYLRVLTATFLKADPTRFIPYLEDGYMDIASFCQTQIEPMGKDVTMVQVLALAEAFGVNVTVEYLDGREFTGDKITWHVFGPDSSKTKLTLLYRPGHYDILYPQ